ncbi:hypothetical protein [Rhodopirellula sp. SWK7]|uniref:hypothetical protein n=1 Tax=Rhodopirellula sp. SWK7 TaxID=595460 RepID=UPI0002C0138D|nr:hypothetical protein [Rhodopirellula sp. SWK7]EMI44339.1 hypothetical protein RRSWK_03140 [Rhodopirellula sp. SWK7]
MKHAHHRVRRSGNRVVCLVRPTEARGELRDQLPSREFAYAEGVPDNSRQSSEAYTAGSS